MARNRLDKTLADYVVIAISPALIMTLVGSLVFFLLDVCYRGQFETRIHWVMFWFVFAAVLVARLAIVEGREHSLVYGATMFALAAIAVFRFVDAVVVGWVMLAIVWWCSSKLTWDCTLIDESVDTSGEGLLQTAGFDDSAATDAQPPDSSDRPPKTDSRLDPGKKAPKKVTSVDGSGLKQTPRDDSLADDDETEKSQLHSPGLWVVYFSLAALPLFGAGQLFIPVEESGRRSYEFVLLAVYVASAILLLLTTSFLSLRRYLRQRKLEMPASVTRGWLGVGTALLVSLLLLAIFIPRPQGEYTLTGMIDKIDAKARQASQFAVLNGDRAEGQGRRTGDQDPNAKQPGDGNPPKSSEKGERGGKDNAKAQQGKENNGRGTSENQSTNKQDGGKQRTGQQNGSQQNGNQQNQNDDRSTQKSGKNESGGKDAGRSEQQKGQPSENQGQNHQQKNGGQNRNGDARPKSDDPDANKTSPSSSSQSRAPSVIQMLAPLVKWILYGLLAIVGLFFLIRHWTTIVEFLARLWAELLSLFVWKSKKGDKSEDEEETVSRRQRPFASYENPFYSGAADRMSPPQLIRYTFEALEAWSREQAVERPPEQTPLEFAEALGERVPRLAKDVTLTAQLYAHVAYARKVPSRDRLEVLERLWRQLGA